MTHASVDRAGLLRAVLEAPQDDTPRLVMADWLEDHGGEGGRRWAELIRVQVELHANRTPGHFMRPAASEANDRRQDWLADREKVLLYPRHPDVPPPALPDAAQWNLEGHDAWQWWMFKDGQRVDIKPTFSRGFARKVRCGWRALLGCHRAIWEAHPVEEVEVTDRGPGFSGEHRRYGWLCDRSVAYSAAPWRLPRSWWSLLALPRAAGASAGSGWKLAESKKAARDALSAAVVKWATGLRARRWKAQAGRGR